jgi:glutathione S-transferase
MPIINSSSSDARNFKGLHLYHLSMSNCSQKARFCLEEKRLEWTSHPVDLVNNQHLTPEFVAINPKGLVPVLVHDGVVVTESSDIIDYVDQHFPNPPLRPSDPAERERMYRWLELWDETQIWLKTLSHNTILRGRTARMRKQMESSRPWSRTTSWLSSCASLLALRGFRGRDWNAQRLGSGESWVISTSASPRIDG